MLYLKSSNSYIMLRGLFSYLLCTARPIRRAKHSPRPNQSSAVSGSVAALYKRLSVSESNILCSQSYSVCCDVYSCTVRVIVCSLCFRCYYVFSTKVSKIKVFTVLHFK